MIDLLYLKLLENIAVVVVHIFTVTFVTIINRKKKELLYLNNKLFSTVTFVTIINRKKKELLYLNNKLQLLYHLDVTICNYIHSLF